MRALAAGDGLWSYLSGRQLLPPAPNQGHYYNHAHEGEGQDGGVARTGAGLGKEHRGGVKGRGVKGQSAET